MACVEKDRLEFSPSKEGTWQDYAGEQGLKGDTNYAIIPETANQTRSDYDQRSDWKRSDLDASRLHGFILTIP